MAAHPGLLAQFGVFQGRKSRRYSESAIVGRADFPRCAVVMAAGATREYTLIYVVNRFPKEVDQAGLPEDAEEYHSYSWHFTRLMLESIHECEGVLRRLEKKSRAHLKV